MDKSWNPLGFRFLKLELSGGIRKWYGVEGGVCYPMTTSRWAPQPANVLPDWHSYPLLPRTSSAVTGSPGLGLVPES